MKNALIIVAIILFVTVGGFIYFQRNKTSSLPVDQVAPTVKTDTSKSYSTEEVSVHKDKQSCWSIIDKKIYDLTSYIDKHKGGPEKVLMICGKDGSELFNKKHGDQEKALKVLENFLIGNLK